MYITDVRSVLHGYIEQTLFARFCLISGGQLMHHPRALIFLHFPFDRWRSLVCEPNTPYGQAALLFKNLFTYWDVEICLFCYRYQQVLNSCDCEEGGRVEGREGGGGRHSLPFLNRTSIPTYRLGTRGATRLHTIYSWNYQAHNLNISFLELLAKFSAERQLPLSEWMKQ
jgi:hypothetical protein